jgi:4-amino-4-deoxy-L-arabinose transferase-like glycosyltransferase
MRKFDWFLVLAIIVMATFLVFYEGAYRAIVDFCLVVFIVTGIVLFARSARQ